MKTEASTFTEILYLKLAKTMSAPFIVAVVEANFLLANVMLSVLDDHFGKVNPAPGVALIDTTELVLNHPLAGDSVPSAA